MDFARIRNLWGCRMDCWLIEIYHSFCQNVSLGGRFVNSLVGCFLGRICIIKQRGWGGVSVGTNIPPTPYSNHSRLMLGNFFLIASTCISVGCVLLLNMLEREAVLMPVILANVCWFMCCASISCFILSFILSRVGNFTFSNLRPFVRFLKNIRFSGAETREKRNFSYHLQR